MRSFANLRAELLHLLKRDEIGSEFKCGDFPRPNVVPDSLATDSEVRGDFRRLYELRLGLCSSFLSFQGFDW